MQTVENSLHQNAYSYEIYESFSILFSNSLINKKKIQIISFPRLYFCVSWWDFSNWKRASRKSPSDGRNYEYMNVCLLFPCISLVLWPELTVLAAKCILHENVKATFTAVTDLLNFTIDIQICMFICSNFFLYGEKTPISQSVSTNQCLNGCICKTIISAKITFLHFNSLIVRKHFLKQNFCHYNII